VQRVLDVPLIGEYIGLVIGIVPPYLMLLLIEYTAFGDASGKSDFIFGVLIFAWNLLLYLGFRVLTTAPIIPIPLFVFGIAVCVIQIIKRLFG